MPNPGTFRGIRLEFLNSQNDAYAAAVASGDVDAFILNTQRRYFKRFPITLPHDEDPTPEWLESVDDDAPADDIQAPDPDTMSAEEYEAAHVSYQALAKELQKRKDSIKRRLQYHYLKTRGKDGEADTKGNATSLAVLSAKLAGKTPTKPRQKTPYNLWGPQHRSITDPVFDARVKKGNVPASKQLALRSTVYKELFGQLPVEEQAEWTKRAEEEHRTALAEHNAATTGSPSTRPIDRQRVITSIPQLISPILELLTAHTGWQFTLMGGGPEPADNGRLNMISLHSGFMPGTVRMDFGRSERQAYRDFIQPTFGRYLSRVYSVDECRTRALPQDHTETPLIAVATEEDLDHRRFDDDEHIKLASSKAIPTATRSAKDTRKASDGAKSSSSSKGAQDVQPDNTQRKELKTVSKKHAATAKASSSSKHVASREKELGTNGNSSKDLPAKGTQSSSRNKKAVRVAPTGKKDKELRPSGSLANAVAPPRAVSHSVQSSTSSSLKTPTPRSVSLPVPKPAPLRVEMASMFRTKPTSVRSISRAPSQAALDGLHTPSPAPSLPPSRAPSRGPSLPPSRAPSRGPSLPPSRAPSRGPSLPPSRAPSRGPSLPPSRAPSRGPLPPPSKAPSRASSPQTTSPTQDVDMDLVNKSDLGILPAAPADVPGLTASATTSASAAAGTNAPTTTITSDPTPTTQTLPATSTTPTTSSTTSALSGEPGRRILSGAAVVPNADVPLQDVASNKRGRGQTGTSGTKRKATADAPQPSKKLRGPTGNAIAPRAFEVNLPANCPNWVENGILHLSANNLGPEWPVLVAAWLKFEGLHGFKQAGPSLSAQHRPAVIGEWMKRARKPTFHPEITDLALFEATFLRWWRSLQPSWRLDGEGWALIRAESADWAALNFPGQNGLLSVLAGLCIWGKSAFGTSHSAAQWALAISDVQYVLTQLV